MIPPPIKKPDGNGDYSPGIPKSYFITGEARAALTYHGVKVYPVKVACAALTTRKKLGLYSSRGSLRSI